MASRIKFDTKYVTKMIVLLVWRQCKELRFKFRKASGWAESEATR